jgi:hypothetical protein
MRAIQVRIGDYTCALGPVATAPGSDIAVFGRGLSNRHSNRCLPLSLFVAQALDGIETGSLARGPYAEK